MIVNGAVREWAGREVEASRLPSGEPVGSMVLGGERVALPRFSACLPTRDFEGDIEQVCLTAGESAGNIRSVEPAGKIVARMTAEARAVIAALSGSGGCC